MSELTAVCRMNSERTKSVTVQPLRDARREFARARICAVAKEIFVEKGFASATMEEIARAAGTQRSTVYAHFRDKDEILWIIAQDYLKLVEEIIAQLPGPYPSWDEIHQWMTGFAEFVKKERTPTVLVLVHAGEAATMSPSIREFGEHLYHVFAAHLPCFARATGAGPEGRLQLARAQVVVRELGWALCHHVESGSTPMTAEKLIVATDLFFQFVHDQRFSAPAPERDGVQP